MKIECQKSLNAPSSFPNFIKFSFARYTINAKSLMRSVMVPENRDRKWKTCQNSIWMRQQWHSSKNEWEAKKKYAIATAPTIEWINDFKCFNETINCTIIPCTHKHKHLEEKPWAGDKCRPIIHLVVGCELLRWCWLLLLIQMDRFVCFSFVEIELCSLSISWICNFWLICLSTFSLCSKFDFWTPMMTSASI